MSTANRVQQIIGGLLALSGLVFFLQGTGIFTALPSFMNNNPTWIWIGLAMIVFGLALALLPTLTRRRGQLSVAGRSLLW